MRSSTPVTQRTTQKQFIILECVDTLCCCYCHIVANFFLMINKLAFSTRLWLLNSLKIISSISAKNKILENLCNAEQIQIQSQLHRNLERILKKKSRNVAKLCWKIQFTVYSIRISLIILKKLRNLAEKSLKIEIINPEKIWILNSFEFD